jgi:CRP-like cAMP-binding protein
MQPLHGMETEHLKKLASIASEVVFSEGETIYQEGDVGQALYLIEVGQVDIEMNLPEGGRVTVYTVGPGQLFGWSSLFPPRRKTASARAVTSTQAIVIEANRLRKLFEVDHTFESVIMRRVTEVVADRVKTTRLQLLSSKTRAPGNSA